jgi:hypothetical protein
MDTQLFERVRARLEAEESTVATRVSNGAEKPVNKFRLGRLGLTLIPRHS